jgi:hypothetical protein
VVDRGRRHVGDVEPRRRVRSRTDVESLVPVVLDPGYSAYETSQTALTIFGNGEQPPLVAVFTSTGDITTELRSKRPSPLDVKQFAIRLAVGIIFDATVIRVLLVPALMRLFGAWNRWLPKPLARLLLVRPTRRQRTAVEPA